MSRREKEHDAIEERVQSPNEAYWKGFLICVNTTPQMTRFRDAKVCNNLATDEINDHRIQYEYKKNCNIQKERTLHLVLRMRGEDSRHQ